MPNAVARVNSVPEVQTITIKAAVSPRVVTLKYLYGSSATHTVYNVTLTAPSPAAFDNVRVGLTLKVNGTSISFPVAWPTAAIDAAIGATLGGVFNAPAVSFGVLKAVRGSSLTLQLGAAFGFNVSDAALVWLARAVPLFVPSPCTYAFPLANNPPLEAVPVDEADATAAMT
jgi:hypothetical protein